MSSDQSGSNERIAIKIFISGELAKRFHRLEDETRGPISSAPAAAQTALVRWLLELGMSAAEELGRLAGAR